MKLERGIGNWVGKVAHNRGGIAKYPSPLAIVRSYRNGSIHRWFHAVPRFSSFIAYSRIPPAVLLRFSRHLAPTLALNLPLTASTDSRSARGIRTIRFFVDPRQTRCENIATKERNRKHGFAKNMKWRFDRFFNPSDLLRFNEEKLHIFLTFTDISYITAVSIGEYNKFCFEIKTIKPFPNVVIERSPNDSFVSP